MKKESIKNINKASLKLPKEMRRLYKTFMTKRFKPNEHYTALDYAVEWANRFKGEPVSYMDDESKQVYYNVILNDMTRR